MAQAVANVVTGQMYRFGDRRTGRRRYGAPQRSWPGADNKTWEKQGFPAAPQRELVLRIGGRAGDAGFPRARSSTRKRNEEGKPESHTASGRRAPRVDLTSLRASRPFASSLSLGAASGGAHAIKTGADTQKSHAGAKDKASPIPICKNARQKQKATKRKCVG